MTGTYLLVAPDGPDTVERFTCGPVGEGWSYTATRHDAATGAPAGVLSLEVDDGGRIRRLHAEAGGWVLRGGAVGGQVLWRRGDQEHEQTAAGFTGTSPAYAVAVVHLLALPVGEQRRVRLVAVTEPVLATRVVDQAWTRVADDRWDAVDLATGEGRCVRLRDGVVVEGTGLSLTRD